MYLSICDTNRENVRAAQEEAYLVHQHKAVLDTEDSIASRQCTFVECISTPPGVGDIRENQIKIPDPWS